MIVCLDRPGVLHLTRVLALGDHELQVVGFGLRPSPFWTRRGSGIGDEKGGLAQHHFPGNHTARLVCDRETGRAYELGVALRKTTAGSSRVSGFEIDYEVDGHSTHFDYRLGIVLCGGALGHDTFDRPTCA